MNATSTYRQGQAAVLLLLKQSHEITSLNADRAFFVEYMLHICNSNLPKK